MMPFISPKWWRQIFPDCGMQPGNIYYKILFMVRVYIANAKADERSALRLMLHNLNMAVVVQVLLGYEWLEQLRWILLLRRVQHGYIQ